MVVAQVAPPVSVFDGIEALGFAPRAQGWENSHSPILAKLASTASTIIEVGSWLGASAIHMAQAGTAYIYCVDTWLGSPEIQPANLMRDCHGHPTAYWQFLTNVKAAGYAERIEPILWPSVTGARVLREREIQADLIYIDGDHTYEGCYADLCAFAPLLAPGGVMLCDDLRNFAGVLPAVVRFAYEAGFTLREDSNFGILRRRP